VKFAQALQIAFVATAAIGVFSFVRTAQDAEARRLCTSVCRLRPNYAARNRLVPDFELPKLGGGVYRMSAQRGKTIVLNFWTKNCQPCMEEMPSVAMLSQMLGSVPGAELVTISTDETMQDVEATLRSVLNAPAPFVVLHDPEGKVVTGLFGTKLYPETWIIDPKGVIRARIDGARNWSDPLTVDYLKLLKEPRSCQVSFEAGQPSGPWAGMCSETSP
jgi:peroxiredoxin